MRHLKDTKRRHQQYTLKWNVKRKHLKNETWTRDIKRKTFKWDIKHDTLKRDIKRQTLKWDTSMRHYNDTFKKGDIKRRH